MELSAVNRRRSWAGWAAALVCLLLVLSVLDGLIARFRQPLNVFHLLPGQAEDIDGPVPEHAGGLQDLGFLSSSGEITIQFQSQEKGFWLGTPLWRGQIRVSDRIRPGDYQVRVIARARGPQPAAPVFLIRIHADAPALQKSSSSLLRRYFGLSPWSLVVFLLPFAAGALGLIFWLSGKREALLLMEGKAEIYRTRRTETGHEISFGLGEAQGVRKGDILDLFDDRGRLLGEVEVLTAEEKDGVAGVGPVQAVRPGYLVAKKK